MKNTSGVTILFAFYNSCVNSKQFKVHRRLGLLFFKVICNLGASLKVGKAFPTFPTFFLVRSGNSACKKLF